MYLFKRPIVALFFQCLNSQCAFESLYQCKIHKIITYFTADFYNHHNTNSGIAHRAAAALQQMPTTWPPRSMCSVCVHNATHGFDNGFVHVYNGRSSAQKAAVASRLTFVFSNVGLLWLASCCHLEAVEIHTDIWRQWISIALINTGNFWYWKEKLLYFTDETKIIWNQNWFLHTYSLAKKFLNGYHYTN